MTLPKRMFTLRLGDEIFDKVRVLSAREHRSMTNYIEYVLIRHIREYELEHGEIDTSELEDDE